MRREDLEIGVMYVGPEDECYEVLDLQPGWKLDAHGEFVPDNTTRSRFTKTGRSQYKTNQLLKAQVHYPSGEVRRTVVDPRRLVGPWTTHLNEQEIASRREQAARTVVRSLTTLLRQHADYAPRPAGTYQVSKSGSVVTLPTDDLRLLIEMAQGYPHYQTGDRIPQIQFLGP